jgi:hypothetical protein
LHSVEDPGSLSRIPGHDFYPSRIPDPTTAPKEKGGKTFLSSAIFFSQKNNNNCK